MNPSTLQNIRLLDEVYTSTMLIKKGFAELQRISGSNDFYHLSILLISSGFERLMKCIISYWYLKKYDYYPPIDVFKKTGHDLDVLLEKIVQICSQFGSYQSREATRRDMDFLINDARLHRIIEILSDFSQGGRYYNLDVVSTGTSKFNAPKDKWEELETELVHEDQHLSELMKDPLKLDEMYQRINMILMKYLERFARALSRIFTLGDIHEEAKKSYSYISDFLNIRDDELGTKKYD